MLQYYDDTRILGYYDDKVTLQMSDTGQSLIQTDHIYHVLTV